MHFAVHLWLQFIQKQNTKNVLQCSLVLAGDSTGSSDVAQKYSPVYIAYLDVYIYTEVDVQMARWHHKTAGLSRAQVAFPLRVYLVIICN